MSEALTAESLVSIIIPTYNTASQLLERSVRSALSQAGPIEVLIVDDGSESSTANHLDDVFSGNPDVTIVHKSNGGVSSARNVGIELCHGDLIAFLDADDVLMPSFVGDAKGALLGSGAEAVWGGVEHCLLDGRVLHSQCQSFSNREGWVVLSADGLDYLVASLFDPSALESVGLDSAMYVSSCSALFRRSAIGDIRFDEAVSISEDRLFNWGVIRNVESVALSNKPWYKYVQNNLSASQRLRPKAGFELDCTLGAIRELGGGESSTVVLESIQKGSYECYKQAMHFSVLHKGFYSACRCTKTHYVRQMLQLPAFRAYFSVGSSYGIGNPLILFAAKYRLAFLLVLMEESYRLPGKLKGLFRDKG